MNKQITIITIIIQTQAKFCICVAKINTKLFYQTLHSSPITKKIFL